MSRGTSTLKHSFCRDNHNMSSSVETSALDFEDPTDQEAHNAALRNRSGDTADSSGD